MVTWNLFHGRAEAPAGPLREEFAAVLRELDWDVALLQEAPPRWYRSNAAGVLTSRNQLGRLRGALAERWPDLMKSNEGGSNQILARAPVTDVHTHTLARWPERRRLVFGRIEELGLCVGNLHASAVGDHSRAAREVLAAAALCVGWAGDSPLVLGGDFNLRPREHPWAFAELEERFGLAPPTADDAIDHLLVRGAEVVEPPHRLAPAVRERVLADGRRVRLSDHAVVAASLRVA